MSLAQLLALLAMFYDTERLSARGEWVLEDVLRFIEENFARRREEGAGTGLSH